MKYLLMVCFPLGCFHAYVPSQRLLKKRLYRCEQHILRIEAIAKGLEARIKARGEATRFDKSRADRLILLATRVRNEMAYVQHFLSNPSAIFYA